MSTVGWEVPGLLTELVRHLESNCNPEEFRIVCEKVAGIAAKHKEEVKKTRNSALNEGYQRALVRLEAIHVDMLQWRRRVEDLSLELRSTKRAEKEAKRRDSRTGLLLDPAFRDDVQKFLRACVRDRRETEERHHEYAAIIFLDLDNLKAVNGDPELGYKYGTRMVNVMTRILHTNLRKATSMSARISHEDPLKLGGNTHDPARLGGDEFAVLLTHLKIPTVAVDIAGRLKQQYDGTKWDNPHMARRRPSVSVGVAVLPVAMLFGSLNKPHVAEQWIEFASKVMMENKHRANIGVTKLHYNHQGKVLERVPFDASDRPQLGMHMVR